MVFNAWPHPRTLPAETVGPGQQRQEVCPLDTEAGGERCGHLSGGLQEARCVCPGRCSRMFPGEISAEPTRSHTLGRELKEGADRF